MERPAPLRGTLRPSRLPWTFLTPGAVSLAIELHRGWRSALIYDRAAVARGQLWRIWTGHLVHFGWLHFIADTGLFVILGFLLEPAYPRLSRFALATMPGIILGSLYFFDPAMSRYGGLSAVNLGLLVFLACRGWQRNWFDWFWPAVLAIYLGEVILEATWRGGRGGGMIPFDDASIQVATPAHIPGAVFGFLMWYFAFRRSRPAGEEAPIKER